MMEIKVDLTLNPEQKARIVRDMLEDFITSLERDIGVIVEVRRVHTRLAMGAHVPEVIVYAKREPAPAPKPHRWNDVGEKCLDCGDPDWLADPHCSGSTK